MSVAHHAKKASIESPVIQRGEKSSRDSQDQNQDESKSQRDVEHDATSYNSNSAKDSSNEHIEVKEQTLPTINSNHDISESEETLDKENVSTHSQADSSEIGDIVRQPLKNIKTIQNAADNADSNIYQFTESNEIETLTLGFGSSVAGSGKAIAVDEEELAKAAKVLADDNRQKSTVNSYDYDEQDEPYNPPSSSGFGFSVAGSGKAIAVDEEELAKAAKVLADDNTQKCTINCVDLCNRSHMGKLFDDDDDDLVAGKNTQKVRFSLGGSTSVLCVNASLEDHSSSPTLPCVPVDADGMIQPPVTPAKYHAFHEDSPVGDIDLKSSLACESEDHINIVTESKDKAAATECFEGQINHLSSSPFNSNAYTPLNLVSRRDSLQSEIKSKRLFERTVSTKKGMHKTVNSDSASVALNADISNSTKVTLRQLAERCHMETEWDNCKEAGVSDVVLKLTSVNALKLRFSEDEGLPSFFFGQRAAPCGNHVGTVDDIYTWLVDEGFDESLFTKKWVQNHYRWIVWKLGSSKCYVFC